MQLKLIYCSDWREYLSDISVKITVFQKVIFFSVRTVREHWEVFLPEWKDKKKDDRISIALVR
jgi:hypothetical protein